VQVLTGGQFEQVRTPGVAVTHFTQAEVRAGDLRFVADGGETAPVVRLVLSDGRTALAPAALQVVFTPVNDAPESSDVSLAAIDEDASRVLTADELLASARHGTQCGHGEGIAIGIAGAGASIRLRTGTAPPRSPPRSGTARRPPP
jgi:hypothetical protein